jgi:hypothetical protein
MLLYITFDVHQEFEVDNLRCVVIGKDKFVEGQGSPKIHVLVIHQSRNPVGDLIWERVGVASLNSIAVHKDGIWVKVY